MQTTKSGFSPEVLQIIKDSQTANNADFTKIAVTGLVHLLQSSQLSPDDFADACAACQPVNLAKAGNARGPKRLETVDHKSETGNLRLLDQYGRSIAWFYPNDLDLIIGAFDRIRAYRDSHRAEMDALAAPRRLENLGKLKAKREAAKNK
jgi:hypothetical protein